MVKSNQAPLFVLSSAALTTTQAEADKLVEEVQWMLIQAEAQKLLDETNELLLQLEVTN